MENQLSPKEARREERLQQKESKFFSQMAKAMDLSKEQAQDACYIILGNIVMRITSQEAGDLLSQMPANVRNILEDLPAGPDRTINAQTVLAELREKMDLNGHSPEHVVGRLWNFLAEFLHEESEWHGELHDVIVQLPADMQELIRVARVQVRKH